MGTVRNFRYVVWHTLVYALVYALHSLAGPAVQSVYRANDTMVVIDWTSGRSTLHDILTGVPIVFDSSRNKPGSPSDADRLDAAVAAVRNRTAAARLARSNCRAIDSTGNIYTCSPIDSHQVSVDIYNAAAESLSIRYLRLATSLEDRFLRLYASPNGRYLCICVEEAVSTCVNYLLRLPSLTLVRKMGNGCFTGFSPNDSVAIFFTGCVCEGRDGRALTYVNIENPAIRLGLDMAAVVNNHLDEPQFHDNFLWAANGRYVRVWSLSDLSLRKRFDHRGLYRRLYYGDDINLYDVSLFSGGDSLIVANGTNGRLRVFVNDGQAQTALIDSAAGPLAGVFFVRSRGVVSTVNRRGKFSTINVPLLSWRTHGSSTGDKDD